MSYYHFGYYAYYIKHNEEVYVEVDDKDNFIIDENNDGEYIITIYSNEARPQLILHKTVKPIRFKELVNNLNNMGNKYYIEVVDSAFQTLPSAFIDETK